MADKIYLIVLPLPIIATIMLNPRSIKVKLLYLLLVIATVAVSFTSNNPLAVVTILPLMSLTTIYALIRQKGDDNSGGGDGGGGGGDDLPPPDWDSFDRMRQNWGRLTRV